MPGLLDRYGLYLEQGGFRQGRDLHAGPRRDLSAGEILGIDGVDGGKIVDIRQKDGGLDPSAQVMPAAARTAFRFSNAWTAWASTPSGSSPVAGSSPSWPEVYNVLPQSFAWQ